jgi:hypothetical protein
MHPNNGCIFLCLKEKLLGQVNIFKKQKGVRRCSSRRSAKAVFKHPLRKYLKIRRKNLEKTA